MSLAAEEFCSANWSYQRDYGERLGLTGRERFPVHRCRACGFVYVREVPDGAFLARVYEEVIAPDFVRGSECPESYSRRMHYCADLLTLVPDGDDPPRALDFGCGLGVTARLLRASRWDVVGFDASPSRIEYVTADGVRVTSRVEDVVDWGPYRIVILDNILEHLADLRTAINAIRSVTGQGAVAYVSVPDFSERTWKAVRRARRNGTGIPMSLNPWEHLNYFNLRHLDTLMASGGFRALYSHELPAVLMGLRAERGFRRVKNAVATALRLARWAAQGVPVESPEARYFVREGDDALPVREGRRCGSS